MSGGPPNRAVVWAGLAAILLCAPFFVVSLVLLAMDHPGRLS